LFIMVRGGDTIFRSGTTVQRVLEYEQQAAENDGTTLVPSKPISVTDRLCPRSATWPWRRTGSKTSGRINFPSVSYQRGYL